MGRYGVRGGKVGAEDLNLTDDMSVADDATFNGDVRCNLGATETFEITQAAMTENLKPLSVGAEVTDLTHGARQGAIYISVNRAATAALTGWDGNPDCGLKIQAYNRAASGANGGVRGIDVVARNRDAGTLSWLNTIYATAENSANTIVQATVGEFHMKNNGVISTAHYGVVIQDDSQGTGPADTIGLKITTGTIAPASGVRASAIKMTDADSTGWTNGISLAGHVANVLDFAAVDGTQGFKVATYTNNIVTANPDAYIKVDGNGTPYYIPVYATIPA